MYNGRVVYSMERQPNYLRHDFPSPSPTRARLHSKGGRGSSSSIACCAETHTHTHTYRVHCTHTYTHIPCALYTHTHSTLAPRPKVVVILLTIIIITPCAWSNRAHTTEPRLCPSLSLSGRYRDRVTELHTRLMICRLPSVLNLDPSRTSTYVVPL
ncbi:hypothetical protein K504DRAFT_142550 [Pleomassaria siparia CBS 279.74]|uniref:Uncharacterized protein n=1 Tax=Pleomassaria siparia CBS 279.74 TaxID=1314801 RepID=A0A6G1KLA8_9PLEO|nr:hypothetical protein K504DRAFT_142550 [Pleomassaria siparia CBS 279.74]